jgi:hypothetical protein
MISKCRLVSGVLFVGLLGGWMTTPLTAQHPVDGIEWMVQNLRATGQPVIPSFDGWFVKEDGTRDLCFGYFNLNLEEALDIPIGPENSLEPARFNGMQPTHFLPVPPPPNLYRRFFCVFTVNVPADFEDRVVWTLVQDGREYTVPGHLEESSYQLSEAYQFNQGFDSWPPLVRFIEPAGPEGFGRSGITADPVTVRVGSPLTLTVSVGMPEYGQQRLTTPTGSEVVPVMVRTERSRSGPTRVWWAKWAKHQGPPGDVAFVDGEIDIFQQEQTVTSTATFSEPGRYLLRFQAIDDPSESASYQFHCCWTNGYVEVNVTP